jgi:hypothetical protein
MHSLIEDSSNFFNQEEIFNFEYHVSCYSLYKNLKSIFRNLTSQENLFPIYKSQSILCDVQNGPKID